MSSEASSSYVAVQSSKKESIMTLLPWKPYLEWKLEGRNGVQVDAVMDCHLKI